MKQLVIKGHAIRGKEIIDLLEMLGAHRLGYNDTFTEFYYYIGDGAICSSEECPMYATIFTLEEFTQKYPFKVGDKVIYTKFEDNYPVIIESMEWTGTTIEYTFNGCVTCLAKDLKFYKPNTIGLKDGKVIDCKVNKETDVNDEVKPIFKVGDEIAKADGLTNSYIVTGVTSKYYSLSGIGVLPVNKQDEYILVNRPDNKEPEPKAPILSNRYDYAEGKCGYVIPDGYEFDCIKEGFKTEIILKPKKPTYPKTYQECCEVLGISSYFEPEIRNATTEECHKFTKLIRLKRCRDTYWKIAGEEMGLGKPWEPDWKDDSDKYFICYLKDELWMSNIRNCNRFLVFPTKEMRNTFYDNFKDLIEECKELL